MTKDLRFGFGRNWKRYLRRVNNKEVENAKRSLSVVLNYIDTGQASFLDIGSGSGLFSRAAHELGFKKVVSFDYDIDSVDATKIIKKMSGADDDVWCVLQGSILDPIFIKKIGSHDVVYSWGVLHHTGAMWQALDNAATMVKPGGILFIALYNDQGWISRYWHSVKYYYVRSPGFIRLFLLMIFWTYFGVGLFLADIVRLRNPLQRHLRDARGMKFFTDVVDWIGGYPFEVASPQQVITRLREQGFKLVWKRLVGRRHGCNEYVFRLERGV